jgi:hypothetical protein
MNNNYNNYNDKDDFGDPLEEEKVVCCGLCCFKSNKYRNGSISSSTSSQAMYMTVRGDHHLSSNSSFFSIFSSFDNNNNNFIDIENTNDIHSQVKPLLLDERNLEKQNKQSSFFNFFFPKKNEPVRSVLEKHLSIDNKLDSKYNQPPENDDNIYDKEIIKISQSVKSAIERSSRNRIAAFSTIESLAPRGKVENSNSNDSNNRSNDNSFGSSERNLINDRQDYYVSVQRWAIRRDRINTEDDYNEIENSSNISSNNNKINNIANDKEMNQIDNKDNNEDLNLMNSTNNNIQSPFKNPNSLTIKAPDKSSSPINNKDLADIEFEIFVRAGISQSLTSAELEWWSGNNGNNSSISSGNNNNNGSSSPIKNNNRWSCWHTSSELLTLHALIVSQLGDLAPRRPRLRSTANLGTSVPHSDIVCDMRTITAYVMALLRNRTYLIIPSILDFLDTPDEYRPSVQKHADTNSQNLVFPALLISNPSNNTIDRDISGGSEQTVSPTGNTQQFKQVEALGLTSIDKWRKLFVNMRVKLKPQEYTIRCRLFLGVISGSEVTGWLIRSESTEEHQYQHAKDRNEACAIGQELLSCGLLVAVCSGLDNDPLYDDEEYEILDGRENDSFKDSVRDSFIESNTSKSFRDSFRESNKDKDVSLIKSKDKDKDNCSYDIKELFEKRYKYMMNKFSDYQGFVYRFPDRSSTGKSVGSFEIFGSVIKVHIPEYSEAEEYDEVSATRDTTNYLINSGSISVFKNNDINGNSGKYIEYLLVINHGNDEWQIWKRFREFEVLHRALVKEGIRPSVSLPNKFSKVFGVNGKSQLDNRKANLELYINSVLEAVVPSENSAANLLVARFLDDDFDHWIIAPPPVINSSNTATL